MFKMKSISISLLASLFVASVLTSCDANKSKVSDYAKQYAQAVNSKDKVVINEMYPNSKNYSCLIMPDTLSAENVEVEYVKEDSVYVAKLNDKQSLVVKVEGEDKLQICDSYGILKLDSASYDLAAKTGTPVTKTSDITNGKMFDNDGDFIKYLEEQYPTAAYGNLYLTNGRWNSRGGWYPSVTIEQPITNGGDKNIKGEDYSVEFVFIDNSTNERIGTETVEGLDIAGGETQVIHIYKSELYRYANSDNKVLNWRTSLKFKNVSTATLLSRYGSFTGKEYDDFLKSQSKEKKDKKEVDKASVAVK